MVTRTSTSVKTSFEVCMGHPNNFFSFPSPDRPTFLKVPSKENITDPYFGNFSENKKVFNLKELYYFEVIF